MLIHAVAGGVGTAAVEIGKQLGIEMYGTSSSDDKLARAQKLGLDHGINYKQVDYEPRIHELTKGEGVDAASRCSVASIPRRACAVAGRLAA